ncbi:hypothetical protein GCM10009789_67660 [Kribbella sancticallisti]|uniref:SdpI/YhfL protein family protein n=2 Tax=Kribbella sancticallisti TaxID=460087 RepID=A0ABN2EDC2_9ACTN
MPSWYDEREDCALTLNRPENFDIQVTTHWLPPRATCDFGAGEVLQFVSTARSVVLTVLFVLFAAATAFSLYLVVRRLAAEPTTVTRSAEAVDLRARKRWHLATGGVLSLLLITVFTVINAVAVILGDAPGAVVSSAAMAAALAGLGAWVDRRTGPLPGTTLDSRRRGVVAGLTVFAAVFAVTGVTGDLPFFRLWAAPVGAVACLFVVAAQWSRLGRTDGGTGDGDAVEEHMLGDPRP